MRYNSSVPSLGARLTDEEIVWLHQYQPHIFYFHKEGKAYGYFALNAQYAGKRIIDKYEIAIDFARLENRAIPLVYEVGGRIRKTACLYNKPLIDLHQYDDNHLCLIRPDIFWGAFLNEVLQYNISSFWLVPSYTGKPILKDTVVDPGLEKSTAGNG